MGGIPGNEIGVVTTCGWDGKLKLGKLTEIDVGIGVCIFVGRVGNGGLIGIPGICGVLSKSAAAWAKKIILYLSKVHFYSTHFTSLTLLTLKKKKRLCYLLDG